MKTVPALLAAAILLTAAAQPVFADPDFRYGDGRWDRGEAHYRGRGFRDCDDDGYRRGIEHHYYPQRYQSRPVYYAPPSYHYYHYDRDDYYDRDHYRDDDDRHHRRHNGGNHDLGLLAIIGGAVLVDQLLLER